MPFAQSRVTLEGYGGEQAGTMSREAQGGGPCDFSKECPAVLLMALSTLDVSPVTTQFHPCLGSILFFKRQRRLLT